jgi:hypothetical protein
MLVGMAAPYADSTIHHAMSEVSPATDFTWNEVPTVFADT